MSELFELMIRDTYKLMEFMVRGQDELAELFQSAMMI